MLFEGAMPAPMPPLFWETMYVGIGEMPYVPDIGISTNKLAILSNIGSVWVRCMYVHINK